MATSVQDRSIRSVFVGNIPYEATEEQLKDIFCEVGPVVSFRLVYDRETGKPKGYGFCEYKDQDTALSAMRNLNGHELNGRPLRVDNAASEKSKEELKNLQASMGGPPQESPYGTDVDPDKAPEAISKAVASLPPEQMFELMKQMKLCIQNNPNEARNMLLQNPQLAYALLQAQVVMKIVDPQVAMALLQRANPNPTALQMPGQPQSSDVVRDHDLRGDRDRGPEMRGMMPHDQDMMRDGRDHRDPHDFRDQRGMGPDHRMDIDVDLRGFDHRGRDGHPPMDSRDRMPMDRMDHRDRIGMGDMDRRGPMDSRDMRGDPRDMRGPMDPRDMRSLDPRGPPMDRDLRGPPMDRDPRGPPMDRDPRGPPMDRDPRGMPMDRDPRMGPMDRDPRGLPMDRDPRGPPMDRGPPPMDRDSRGPPMEPRDSRDPRSHGDRPGFDPRQGRGPFDQGPFDNFGRSPGQMDHRDPRGPPPPPAPAPGPGQPPRGPLQMPPARPGLPPAAGIGPVRPPRPGAPGVQQDQEKAALIMQVLQLSDQQIAMLPQDQRQSILLLKEQISRTGQ